MKKEVVLPKKIIIGIVVILVLVTIGIVYVVYSEKQKATAAAALNEVQGLVDALSKITELPNEQPTIATVTDKEKLKQYPFFTKAESGDKVLIFNQAKKAYLYRPSSGKLIEVGPITLADQTATPSATLNESSSSASQSATQKTISLTILNGTKTVGLASRIQKDIEANSELKNFKVKTKGNAKKDYPKTLITVSNPQFESDAKLLAKSLNAEIVTFPGGEDPSSTDITIFLGEDKK